MTKINKISHLMLERYHRGNTSVKEQKIIKDALKSDIEAFLFLEDLKKSDEEIRLLYPLDKLPQLYAIRDTIVPIQIAGNFSKDRLSRKWSGRKKFRLGLGAAAVLCIVFSLFLYSKLININGGMVEYLPVSNEKNSAILQTSAGNEHFSYQGNSSGTEGFFPITRKPEIPGLPYDDSKLSDSVTRSRAASTTSWEGTGFVSEGPPGVTGQMPPAYKDMSNLYGQVSQNTWTTSSSQSDAQSWKFQAANSGNYNTSEFDNLTDNPFRRVIDAPLSTFSVDVDTAGYSMTRYFLTNGQMPPRSAVRIEELINYFDYNYQSPTDEKPFAVHVETGIAPWNKEHLLSRIAIKGREFPVTERPNVNLVFLLDVSGSMDEPNRLPLVISSMKLLVNELKGNDKVAICVYAGTAGIVLPPTSGDDKNKILAALDQLHAGGSTAGGAGIQLAYQLAQRNFNPLAVNRIILCTDGDFNVGITNRSELEDLISQKAKSGVYLTVLGFGMDNYRDGTLKQLASKGNGNYGYIDTLEESRKIMLKQLSATLITIAQDVKIQIEFNPENVGAYRLIGYENRLLHKEDFNDDSIDAGDIGAGHTVTAFYELIPSGADNGVRPIVDPLKYGPAALPGNYSDELLTVKLRYKLPKETESLLLSYPVNKSSVRKAGKESEDFRFAAAVAGFGMLLRESPHKGNTSYSRITDLARTAIGKDPSGYRRGFLELIKKAQAISN